MRRNLVIVRGGRNSLHPRWLQGGERNWDLMLCPYEDGPADSDFPVPAAVPGQKWLGLYRLLRAEEAWRRYEYVWLPDDDLLAGAADISRFFDLCGGLGSRLAQPALSEESHFTFPITMRNRAFFARATTFVEIMAPCFQRETLERLLPIIGEAETGWGWGLSYAWAKALDYRGIHIVDAAPVWHTRPVGALRSPRDHKTARDEWARMLSAHKTVAIKRTLHACDQSGAKVALGNGRFLLDYIGGYDYLIERNPKVMLQLVRDQISPDPSWNPRRRRRRGWLGQWWQRLRRPPRKTTVKPTRK